MREQILQRIRDLAPSFKYVGSVASMDAVVPRGNAKPRVSINKLPAAILYVAGGSAGRAQDRPGGYQQQQTRRWGVMIITQSRNDACGEKHIDLADDLEDELDRALLSYQPECAKSGIRKSANAGRLISWTADRYHYAANYEVDRETRIHRG